MDELLFIVTPEPEGGYSAAAIGLGIFTQGDTWEDLCAMVLDATKAYFYDSQPPLTVRLLMREQVLAVA